MDRISRDIVNNILNGNDQKVIDDLYKNVFPNVKHYLIKNNGTKEEAEDCFQEALMRFYKYVLKGEFDSKYKVHGFVFTLSKRLWLNEMKKKKSTVSFDKLEHVASETDPVTHKTDSDTNDQRAVLDVLSKLGEKCKKLLHATIYSDLLNEDIMIRFGYQSVAAVKMRHKRCKQKMIEYLKSNPQIVSVLRTRGSVH